jgi:hypothetical protein
MDDLKQKIVELRKSLLSLKEQRDVFAPAIKQPAIKVPKVPNQTANKLPGIAPDSKKDPIKVAEQLKNPRPKKVKVEILKVEDNGQWSLSKASEPGTFASSPKATQRIATNTAPVNAVEQGHFNNRPAQNALVHGLKVHQAAPIGKATGIANAMFATSDAHPHTAVVKNSAEHPDQEPRGHNKNGFNSAKREVLYHNLAHDFFGMGKHVPLTAGFTRNNQDWSAQKKVDDAGHVRLKSADAGFDALDQPGDFFEAPADAQPKQDEVVNPNHARVLNDLHRSGDTHKMALMDNIMGHHDRHGGNYMVDNKGDNMHLIDNGTAFDYGNFDNVSLPSYLKTLHDKNISGMGHDNASLHPEAAKWLNQLDPEHAKKVLADQGHDENSDVSKNFVKRLNSIKERSSKKDYKNVDDLLHSNRSTTGPVTEKE